MHTRYLYGHTAPFFGTFDHELSSAAVAASAAAASAVCVSARGRIKTW